MKIINIESYSNIESYNFQSEGHIPSKGIIRVGMREIPEFFSRCVTEEGPYIILSYNDDTYITLQAPHTLENDFIKNILFNTEHIASFISGTGGMTPLIVPPQCDINKCSHNDTHIIKTAGYTYSTFNLSIPDNVHMWYSVNNDTNEDKVTHIPFGVNHPCPQFDIPVEDAQVPLRDKADKLYVNFSDHTLQRRKLKELFRNYDWVTTVDKESKLAGIPHEQFMDDLAYHKFVMCSRGVGLDCFRTWETLYVGSIPVIEWQCWSEWMEELPIIFVDKYSSIDSIDILLEAADNMKDMIFKPALLSEEYWLAHIRRSWEECND